MKFDAVVIGGGRSGMAKAVELQKNGSRCAVVCKGHSLYGFSPDEFISLGGVFLNGDEAVGGVIEDGRVTAVHTARLGEDALEASVYYLATGRFFAGGLCSDMNRVYEPVFDLDVRFGEDPSGWFGPTFASEQPFMDFGVIVDSEGRALKGGSVIENLFPIGEIIAK